MITKESENGLGMADLVNGIIHDAQDLIRQQLTLFQVEIKKDLHRTRDAAIPLAIGAVVCLLAGMVLSIMLAHLLHEVFHLPLWGGFAVVGGVLALGGGALVLWGKNRFESFNPLPDQAVEGLKENIQWKTKT